MAVPHGAPSGGGLGSLVLWELGPGAVWFGIGCWGGLVRLTRSKPDESDLLSDSGIWQSSCDAGIDCVNFDSFAGK